MCASWEVGVSGGPSVRVTAPGEGPPGPSPPPHGTRSGPSVMGSAPRVSAGPLLCHVLLTLLPPPRHPPPLHLPLLVLHGRGARPAQGEMSSPPSPCSSAPRGSGGTWSSVPHPAPVGAFNFSEALLCWSRPLLTLTPAPRLHSFSQDHGLMPGSFLGPHLPLGTVFVDRIRARRSPEPGPRPFLQRTVEGRHCRLRAGPEAGIGACQRWGVGAGMPEVGRQGHTGAHSGQRVGEGKLGPQLGTSSAATGTWATQVQCCQSPLASSFWMEGLAGVGSLMPGAVPRFLKLPLQLDRDAGHGTLCRPWAQTPFSSCAYLLCLRP